MAAAKGLADEIRDVPRRAPAARFAWRAAHRLSTSDIRQIVSMPGPAAPERIDAAVIDMLRRRPPGPHVLVYLDHSTLSSLALEEPGFPPLLKLLREAVEADRLVCAFSPEHREESLLAQPGSYDAIDRLGDELSVGVMMRHRKDIEWREINAAAGAFLGHAPDPIWAEAFRDDPHTPRKDRFVSLFGGNVRVKVRFDVEEWQRDEIRNQKAREDPMTDAYRELREAGYSFEELAEANLDAMLTWKLGPMFDAGHFTELLEERAKAAANPSLTEEEQTRAFLRFTAFEQLVTGTLELVRRFPELRDRYAEFKLSAALRSVPTLRYPALLRAALAADPNRRRPRPSDGYDVDHLTAGLSRCDLVTADRAMHHLVTSRGLVPKGCQLCATRDVAGLTEAINNALAS